MYENVINDCWSTWFEYFSGEPLHYLPISIYRFFFSFLSIFFSICLTPWECKYSTVLVSVQMTSDASRSVKSVCVRTLSRSSFPLGMSKTKKKLWPSSNTFRGKRKGIFLNDSSPTLVVLVQFDSLCVLLTSLRVIMFGCCPYLSRISISSDGSFLVRSIIC